MALHRDSRLLTPPSYDGFITRDDPDDPRMGDLIDRGEYPGERVRLVIIGCPQDEGVRRNGGRPGAAGGPGAFRTMLARLTPYNLLTDSSLPVGSVWDAGDVRCEGTLEEVHARLHEVVAAVCGAGRLPVVIGGGHDITYPVIAGAASVHGALGALNVDAHLDVRPPSPHRNSGTSFRMAVDEGLVAGARFVELGVQEFANARAHVHWVRERGGEVVSLEEVRRVGIDAAVGAALERASAEGTAPLYATLDMDAVCAAAAPGVSAPMPDGLSAADLLGSARAIGRHPQVVAFDVAELNPGFDVDGRTARLAARAAMAFMAARLA